MKGFSGRPCQCEPQRYYTEVNIENWSHFTHMGACWQAQVEGRADSIGCRPASKQSRLTRQLNYCRQFPTSSLRSRCDIHGSIAQLKKWTPAIVPGKKILKERLLMNSYSPLDYPSNYTYVYVCTCMYISVGHFLSFRKSCYKMNSIQLPFPLEASIPSEV